MANRYLITGGSSVVWDASNTGIWSSASGGATGASVPVDGDAVIFDGSSGGGTVTLGYSPTVTSITMGAFTGTFDASTFSPTMDTFNNSGTGTRTLNMGMGNVWTMRGSAATVWNQGTTTNLTLNKGTSTVNCVYAGSAGTRTFNLGATGVGRLNAFKISAGSDAVSFQGGTVDFDLAGYTGAFTFSSGSDVQGLLRFGAGMSVVSTASTITLSATTSVAVTSNGVQANLPITFNGVGGTWTLQDSLNMDGATPRALTLTNGTFNANGYNVTCGSFSQNNSNTRSFILGTGTLALTGTGTIINTSSGGTPVFSVASGVISITDTSASSKTMVLATTGTTNIGEVRITSGGTGAVIFSNGAGKTIGTLTSTGPKTITFNAGQVYTITNLNLTGTAGNLVTLNSSTPGSQYTLSVASGDVYARYVSLQDSNATGGARFFALNSTNVSNNTGWNFVASRTAASNRFLIRNENAAVQTSGTDGSAGNVIQVANSPSLNPTAAVTVEIWCRPTSLKAGALFDNSQGGATNSYTVYMGADLSLLWFSTIGGVGKNIVTTASRLRLNDWNLVTATYDGANVILMANGSTFATLAATGSLGTNANALQIGAIYNGAGGLTFPGQLSRPRVYAAGCTLAEHQDRYYRGLTSANLLANLKMDLDTSLGAGTSVTDLSGTGNTGTLGAGGSWTGITPFKSRKRDDGNLVQNGTFEYAPPFVAATTAAARFIDGTSGGSTTNNLFSWATVSGAVTASASASFDGSVSFSGANSIKLSTLNATGAIVVSNTTATGAPTTSVGLYELFPNTSYTLSVKCKTSNVASNGAFAFIREYTGALAIVATNNTAKLTGTNDWTTLSVVITTGSTTRLAAIALCNNVAGNVSDAWFDDVTLTATTPQVRTAVTNRYRLE